MSKLFYVSMNKTPVRFSSRRRPYAKLLSIMLSNQTVISNICVVNKTKGQQKNLENSNNIIYVGSR